jgi:hypothetical protein
MGAAGIISAPVREVRADLHGPAVVLHAEHQRAVLERLDREVVARVRERGDDGGGVGRQVRRVDGGDLSPRAVKSFPYPCLVWMT